MPANDSGRKPSVTSKHNVFSAGNRSAIEARTPGRGRAGERGAVRPPLGPAPVPRRAAYFAEHSVSTPEQCTLSVGTTERSAMFKLGACRASSSTPSRRGPARSAWPWGHQPHGDPELPDREL